LCARVIVFDSLMFQFFIFLNRQMISIIYSIYWKGVVCPHRKNSFNTKKKLGNKDNYIYDIRMTITEYTFIFFRLETCFVNLFFLQSEQEALEKLVTLYNKRWFELKNCYLEICFITICRISTKIETVAGYFVCLDFLKITH